MSKKRYHHGNLKHEALKQALQLSKEKPLFEWSLRELAKAMGVSHVALYNHFATKHDLLYALATQGFESLIEQSNNAKNLKQLGKIYIEFAINNPVVFDAMFHPQLPPSGSQRFAQISSEYVNYVHGFIKDSFVANNEALFLQLWSSVHGYAHLSVRGAIGSVDISEEIKAIDGFLDFQWQLVEKAC